MISFFHENITAFANGDWGIRGFLLMCLVFVLLVIFFVLHWLFTVANTRGVKVESKTVSLVHTFKKKGSDKAFATVFFKDMGVLVCPISATQYKTFKPGSKVKVTYGVTRITKQWFSTKIAH